MKAPEEISAPSSALHHREHMPAALFNDQSKSAEGKPNFDNIHAELSSHRPADNKISNTNEDSQLSPYLSNINQYLRTKNLPAMAIDSEEPAPKLEAELKEAVKSKDFTDVYGRLDGLKAADERKYGQPLGDLLFLFQLQDLNGYFHKNGLPDLSITGDGESVTRGLGSHKRVISNSGQEASRLSMAAGHVPYQGHSPEGRARQAAAGHATSAMGEYIKLRGSDQSGAMVGLTGGETATSNQIMNKLVNDYGLSPAGAAGVVGNMTQENHLSTAVDSGGIGLCQWIGSRAVQERQFAQAMGQSPTSLNAQLGFMMQELKQNYPELLATLQRTGDPQRAALAFSKTFERPGKPQNANRMDYALDAKRRFDNV